MVRAVGFRRRRSLGVVVDRGVAYGCVRAFNDLGC